jgi:anti-anti-sigma regulatory factor
MLKITVHPEPKATRLVLEGRLAGPWVEELDRCWGGVIESHQAKVLVDLTGVTFIDCEGKVLLTRMWKQGAELHAAGCLTRCIVDDITNAGRSDSCSSHRRGKRT